MSLLTLDRIIHLLALAVHRGERLLFWTASKLGALSPFRLMPGRIPGHHRDGSGSQHYVLPQELSRQVEHGEACYPWSNHENGQRPGKQHEGQQTDIAHPKTSDKHYASNDFKGAEHIDERAIGQERKRQREQDNDRLGILKMQGSNPEQDQAQADAQERPRNPLGETEQRTEQRLHQKTSFLGNLEAPS